MLQLAGSPGDDRLLSWRGFVPMICNMESLSDGTIFVQAKELPPGKLAYSLKTAAGLVDLCERTLRRDIKAGLLRRTVHGLILHEELERWLKSEMPKPRAKS